MLLTVTLTWGCLRWGVPSQAEGWTHGEHGPRPSSVPLLRARVHSLPHLAVPCRSETSPLVCCVVKAGFQLRPCCWPAAWQGAEGPSCGTSPVSRARTNSLRPAFWESQAAVIPPPSSIHEEKGALFGGETSAGDVPGMFHVFRSAMVTVFVGGLLKNRALRCLQVPCNYKLYKVTCKES